MTARLRWVHLENAVVSLKDHCVPCNCAQVVNDLFTLRSFA
ncbi:hypothetical protein FOHLNKBM_1679 [Methylobacterium longum]|nr:hypothetical protein FOHLNKBM_1679 [Methylobacterium longum]